MDEALQTALIKRDENLTPNSTEQTAITNLVNTVQSVLDGLIVSGIKSMHFELAMKSIRFRTQDLFKQIVINQFIISWGFQCLRNRRSKSGWCL